MKPLQRRAKALCTRQSNEHDTELTLHFVVQNYLQILAADVVGP